MKQSEVVVGHVFQNTLVITNVIFKKDKLYIMQLEW